MPFEGWMDIFISKLDSAGNFVWAKRIGGSTYDNAYSISLDGMNKVYTTGRFTGTVDFDPGTGVFNLTAINENIYINKLDESSNFVWAVNLGGSSNESGNSVVADASGNNIYTTGWFGGTADFDPGAGVFNLTGAGLSDMFIQKMSNPVGIDMHEMDNGISISPNPFTSEISITLQNQNINQATISIKNILGQTVFSKQLPLNSNPDSYRDQTSLDLSFLSKGIYLLEVNTGNGMEVRKIVKE